MARPSVGRRCRRWRAWIVVLLALVSCRSRGEAPTTKGGAGSETPAAASSAATRGPTDRFAFASAEPSSIDPALLGDTAAYQIAMDLFEGLLVYPRGDGDVLPGVAERYEISPDGRTYTFHLRADAKWSDGAPVVADDFRWSWLRKLDSKTASRSAEHLWPIVGAKAFSTGGGSVSNVGIEAKGDRTLVVRLEHPLPWFKWYVAGAHYAPTPRHVVEKHGKAWTRPEHIVTNGPFTLTTWRSRDRAVLERSETWWARKTVALREVIIYFSESETASLDWYRAGKVQWVQGTVPLDRVRRFRAERREDFHVVPILCVYYYAFRTDRRPFDDPRVRQAFNLAIDKERLVRHVLGGGQRPATHLVPELFGAMGYAPVEGGAFDPQRARALLAEAGYPGGAGLGDVELLYNTYEVHRIIAEYVQRNVLETLGVKLIIRNMEWKSLLGRISSGDFQLGRFGWCAMRDPYEFLKILRSDSPNNHTAWTDETLDGLIDSARAESVEATRLATLARAERLLADKAPVLPLFFYTRPYLLNRRVCGFEDNPEDVHLLRYLSYAERCTGGVNAR